MWVNMFVRENPCSSWVGDTPGASDAKVSLCVFTQYHILSWIYNYECPARPRQHNQPFDAQVSGCARELMHYYALSPCRAYRDLKSISSPWHTPHQFTKHLIYSPLVFSTCVIFKFWCIILRYALLSVIQYIHTKPYDICINVTQDIASYLLFIQILIKYILNPSSGEATCHKPSSGWWRPQTNQIPTAETGYIFYMHQNANVLNGGFVYQTSMLMPHGLWPQYEMNGKYIWMD